MRLDEGPARQLFRSRFVDSPMPQALIAPDGAIELANPALCALLGRTEEELAGKRPRELRHELDRPEPSW